MLRLNLYLAPGNMSEWAANGLGAATTSPSNRGHASFVHIPALIALRLCCVPCGALIDGPGVYCTILRAAAIGFAGKWWQKSFCLSGRLLLLLG